MRKLGNIESKKQNAITRSNAEVEFKGIWHGICKMLWLKLILDDLGKSGNERLDP